MQIRVFEATKGRSVAIDFGISYKYWSTLLPKKTDLFSQYGLSKSGKSHFVKARDLSILRRTKDFTSGKALFLTSLEDNFFVYLLQMFNEIIYQVYAVINLVISSHQGCKKFIALCLNL